MARAHAGSSEERQAEGEENDGGAVVEQTLALEQLGEAPRAAQVPEQADHSDWIGRRDQSSEHERMLPAEAGSQSQLIGNQEEDEGSERGRGHHAWDRERRDRDAVVPELPKVDVERGLEDQAREKYIEQEILGQLRRREQLQCTEHQPRQHQRYRVGQTHPRRGDGDGGGQHEQQDEARLDVHGSMADRPPSRCARAPCKVPSCRWLEPRRLGSRGSLAHSRDSPAAR